MACPSAWRVAGGTSSGSCQKPRALITSFGLAIGDEAVAVAAAGGSLRRAGRLVVEARLNSAGTGPGSFRRAGRLAAEASSISPPGAGLGSVRRAGRLVAEASSIPPAGAAAGSLRRAGRLVAEATWNSPAWAGRERG